MSANTTNYTTESTDYKNDTCRAPSCHSRVQVRRIITENGSVMLCRHCRKLYLGVSS